MRTNTLVVSIYDACPSPVIGKVLGHEDEDRIMVAWGDEMYAEWPAARIVYEDTVSALGRRERAGYRRG